MVDAETIEFSRDLYPLEAVQNTVSTYDGLASFDVKATVDVVSVSISKPDPDLASVLADEFCNHALSESVRLRRAEAL